MASGIKYTVKYGDTLSEIAMRNNIPMANLVKWNKITDPDFIVTGQVLYLYDPGASVTTTQNNTYKATIKYFGVQSNSDRTMYATWDWNKPNTEKYQVIWEYYTNNNVWFVGSDTEVKVKQCTYNAPSNATRVRFKVKPVIASKTTNGTSTTTWTATWSTVKNYSFSENPPEKPSVPSIKIDKYNLTVEVSNLQQNANYVYFEIVKNDTSVFKRVTVKANTKSASYTCVVDAGCKYKVRCRAQRYEKVTVATEQSDLTDYSQNVDAPPAIPSGITTCKATSRTSIYLEWKAVNTAKTYDIEYATKKEYFDRTNQTTTQNGIEFTYFELVGLQTGSEYFFRVRAVNTDGSFSGWSGIKSVILGRDPAAPTTWSSVNSVVIGEPLILYWVHNSQDGSSQTYAELEIYANGVLQITPTIKNSTDEDEKDKTSSYSIDTTDYDDGAKIEWRVRTAGVTSSFGEWSVKRTVDIYAPPVFSDYRVSDAYGNHLSIIESFPFYVSALAGPNTQKPVGYYLSVISKNTYETIDQVGNFKTINIGDKVYSKFIDTSDPLLVEFSANNIDLENNCEYTVTCLVSMDSSLTAETSLDITVAWTDEQYEPNAEIGINEDDYTAMIRPYCEDASGNPIPDISLSVYRRDFDGGFTEIISEVPNGLNRWVTDPHPALDYARYRVVAVSNITGAVSFYDIPGYPVNGKAAIIQWNEDWTIFDVSSENALSDPPWSGSLLKLPYNISVSSSNRPDVALVEYIGRSHPVAYYGTQLGETQTWSMSIDKDDKETLYALRRLAKWMGDVYVREPSGSGYWANVTVSFNQKYDDLTIPITINVTRVEGEV